MCVHASNTVINECEIEPKHSNSENPNSEDSKAKFVFLLGLSLKRGFGGCNGLGGLGGFGGFDGLAGLNGFNRFSWFDGFSRLGGFSWFVF